MSEWLPLPPLTSLCPFAANSTRSSYSLIRSFTHSPLKANNKHLFYFKHFLYAQRLQKTLNWHKVKINAHFYAQSVAQHCLSVYICVIAKQNYYF